MSGRYRRISRVHLWWVIGDVMGDDLQSPMLEREQQEESVADSLVANVIFRLDVRIH